MPLVRRLPGVRHTAHDVPDVELVRTGVRTELDHLERYRDLCGFPRGDTLPATYPHVAAFGLHLTLMTDTAFPFEAMGLVHLRNSITQNRTIGTDERYDMRVRATSVRPHPRGSLVDLSTDVTVEGELVWHEVTTLLSRHSRGAPEMSPSALETLDAPPGVVHWQLSGDLGRHYGAVSGDRNPIHLTALTARALGYRKPIAHGMWTKGRCLAALHNRLPESFHVEVEFRKPVLLPTTVVLGSRVRDGAVELGVRSAHETLTHLVGRVTPL